MEAEELNNDISTMRKGLRTVASNINVFSSQGDAHHAGAHSHAHADGHADGHGRERDHFDDHVDVMVHSGSSDEHSSDEADHDIYGGRGSPTHAAAAAAADVHGDGTAQKHHDEHHAHDNHHDRHDRHDRHGHHAGDHGGDHGDSHTAHAARPAHHPAHPTHASHTGHAGHASHENRNATRYSGARGEGWRASHGMDAEEMLHQLRMDLQSVEIGEWLRVLASLTRSSC